MLLNWKNKLWFDWMEKKDPSMAETGYFRLAKELKAWDVMDNTQDSTVIIAVLLAAPDPGPRQEAGLYYWDGKGPKFPLDLDFTKYLSTAIEYRAMSGWQHFFIRLNEGTCSDELWKFLLWGAFYTMIPRMEEFLKALERLFPEQNSAELHVRPGSIRAFGKRNNLLQ